MGLATLREVLRDSVAKKYAVGAFDSMDHLFSETIIEASEEKGTPVILMFCPPIFREVKDLRCFFRCTHDMIRTARVPIALLLDHATSIDECIKAISLGFSGVMFDGSLLPHEENIAMTRRVVEIAHACGVSVEAEIGHVAGPESGSEDGTAPDESKYTKPEDAAMFAEATGVDALAVAIGTVHGLFLGTPKLDIGRLVAIRRAVGDLPLVMHGGSGLSEQDFKNAIRGGINKINFFTGMSHAASEAVRALLEGKRNRPVHFMELTAAGKAAMKQVIKTQIEIFGTQPLES